MDIRQAKLYLILTSIYSLIYSVSLLVNKLCIVVKSVIKFMAKSGKNDMIFPAFKNIHKLWACIVRLILQQSVEFLHFLC